MEEKISKNMVVPCFVNQKTTINEIVESILNIKKRIESEECILEVEGKLGFIQMSNIDSFTYQIMEEFSIKNYLDLNCLKNLKKNFVSNQYPETFYNTLSYFENVYDLAQNINFEKLKENESNLHDYLKNFKTSNEEFTIDYILAENKGKKTRLTVNPFTNEKSIMEKSNMRHIDLLHNRNFKINVSF